MAAGGRAVARRHIVWVDEPFDRVLSVMPPMYADLWTAGKGMYKIEPAVADGGEVIIYAPHVHEVSHVHGTLIEEVGYHCRDYFGAQWDRFARTLAASSRTRRTSKASATSTPTAASARESRSRSPPASRRICAADQSRVCEPRYGGSLEWPDDLGHDALMVPRAGELLFRVGAPPDGA